MELEVTKVSSKGQIVVPKDMRKSLRLKEGDRLLVLRSDETMVLKKLEKRVIEKTFKEVTKPFRDEALRKGITEKDIERIVHEFRKEKK